MAATIEAILDAVEDAIDGIAGLRVKDVNPESINVTGNASQAVVAAPEIPTYRVTMGRGFYELDIPIFVFVSANLSRTGQKRLAGFASQTGATSMRAAVEADKTLGGVVSDSYLASYRPLGLEEVAAIGYYGGLFTVRIVTPGV